jgi:hypothetical protein
MFSWNFIIGCRNVPAWGSWVRWIEVCSICPLPEYNPLAPPPPPNACPPRPECLHTPPRLHHPLGRRCGSPPRSCGIYCNPHLRDLQNSPWQSLCNHRSWQRKTLQAWRERLWSLQRTWRQKTRPLCKQGGTRRIPTSIKRVSSWLGFEIKFWAISHLCVNANCVDACSQPLPVPVVAFCLFNFFSMWVLSYQWA